ncbi:MAG: endo-1,4-beta-xylanase [Candidatus Tumulicola sp.]
MSRRSAIGTIIATVAAGALETLAYGAPEGLASAAASHRRFFGAAVRTRTLLGERDLREAILRECGHLVPEFEMNWNAIEPSYGQLSFDRMDTLASFAAAHGKPLRGHTLLWHLGVPDWAVGALRERRDWTLIARYFGSLIPRYGDVIDRWEVVNEPLDPGHRPDGLRQSVFLEAFGPDYIPRALEQARIFAPRAQLIVNEYGLEYDLPDERARRYLFLKLLERLKHAEAPLDGIGVQAHLDLRKGSVSQPAIAQFLRDVSGLGLSVIVTELDVKEANYAASPEVRDRLVGDEVRRYLDVVLSQRGVLGVTTWGLSDRHSWLEVTKDDYGRFTGAWTDGGGPGLNRGLPLDGAMRPKPMYYAIEDALSSITPGSRQSF